MTQRLKGGHEAMIRRAVRICRAHGGGQERHRLIELVRKNHMACVAEPLIAWMFRCSRREHRDEGARTHSQRCQDPQAIG
jgi:hypothetical protein